MPSRTTFVADCNQYDTLRFKGSRPAGGSAWPQPGRARLGRERLGWMRHDRARCLPGGCRRLFPGVPAPWQARGGVVKAGRGEVRDRLGAFAAFRGWGGIANVGVLQRVHHRLAMSQCARIWRVTWGRSRRVDRVPAARERSARGSAKSSRRRHAGGLAWSMSYGVLTYMLSRRPSPDPRGPCPVRDHDGRGHHDHQMGQRRSGAVGRDGRADACDRRVCPERVPARTAFLRAIERRTRNPAP